MQQNKEFYNAWANNYDLDENSTIFSDEITFPNLYMAQKINNALEIGCGTGRHIRRLEEISKNLTMIDLSPNMLEIAKQKSLKSNTKFINCDIFDDFNLNEKFDLIIMSLVLEHIENIEQIFTKIIKLLSPKGRFCLSEIHPSRMLAGSGARFIDPQSQNEIRGKSFCHDALKIENAALNAGFEIVQKITNYGNSIHSDFNPNWKKYHGKPMILVYEFLNPKGN